MSSKQIRNFFFVAGLLAVGWMLYKMGLAELWKNITDTGIWFLWIIASWLVIYMLNALALSEIIYERRLPGSRLPFNEILRLTISGYAINYITPVVALGGEPYRIMELKGRLGISKATSSVLLYTIMHMLSHILFWMVSIILILIYLKPGPQAIFWCIVTFLVFFFLIGWVFKKYKGGLIVYTFRLLAKWPWIGKKIQRLLDARLHQLQEIDQHVIDLFGSRKPTFYASLMLEFVGRIVGCLEIYFVARAVQADVGFLDTIVISAGSSLFANVLFFSPMQLGTREGGFILALKSIGLSSGLGLYMGIVTRIRELFWIAIGVLLMKAKKIFW